MKTTRLNVTSLEVIRFTKAAAKNRAKSGRETRLVKKGADVTTNITAPVQDNSRSYSANRSAREAKRDWEALWKS